MNQNLALIDHFELRFLGLKIKCTGDLIWEGIAPFSGELKGGIDSLGINQRKVSAESVVKYARTIKYTKFDYLYDHKQNMDRFSSNMDSLLKESRWDQTTVYLLQMRQWDEEDFQRIINTDQYLECLEKNLARALKPLETLLQIIRHDFSEEERKFISDIRRRKGQATVVPAGLSFLFPSVEEARKILCLNPHIIHSLPDLKNRLDSSLKGWSFNGLFARSIHLKLTSTQDVENEKDLFSEELQKIKKRYRKLLDVITMEKPKVQIPKDKLIRQMIKHPVPVLFASTTYIPKEHATQTEFFITEPIRLGKGGCDLLFTDTEESRQKLIEILPESLRQEVTIHLFDDAFKDLPFPVYHNPKKVRRS